jgi:hypothetical protein
MVPRGHRRQKKADPDAGVRVAETFSASYREEMTTAENFRDAAGPTPELGVGEILVAGVPWPAYKVWALILGLVVFTGVFVVTSAASPAVLGGAAAATLVWLTAGYAHRTR